MPPYRELFPVGTKVRVASRPVLDAFVREWTFHHKLEPSQLSFADRTASVQRVEYHHGGDVLYVLDGAPGTWHESCLLPAP